MLNFSVHHAISCRNGGLGIARHNEVRGDIMHLAIQALSYNCVRGIPLIHQGRKISEGEVHHVRRIPETRGDVSNQGLWQIQIEVTIDVRFGDADAETWNIEGMDMIFPRWEKLRKDKHRQH